MDPKWFLDETDGTKWTQLDPSGPKWIHNGPIIDPGGPELSKWSSQEN